MAVAEKGEKKTNHVVDLVKFNLSTNIPPYGIHIDFFLIINFKVALELISYTTISYRSWMPVLDKRKKKKLQKYVNFCLYTFFVKCFAAYCRAAELSRRVWVLNTVQLTSY